MKKKIITLFSFSFVLVLTFVVMSFLAWQSFLPVSKIENQEKQDFLITKGSSVTQIGNNLKNKALIRSSFIFKLYIQLTNNQNKIQAGEYLLSSNMSMFEVIETLKSGPKELWVTIPEGLRREEIAYRFATTLNKDNTFIDEFLKLTETKEGYLFPDTYLFAKQATATQIVKKMTSTFEAKTKQATEQEIIIASLLERETLSDAEKPIVAGILYKRLENDWPLQVDATLQYAVASSKCLNVYQKCDYWPDVLIRDKEINSSYNTYKYLGLPPAPISNPGLTSIQAAQNPEESFYWYYIHDTKGFIHYASTLEEHNQNVNKYLR